MSSVIQAELNNGYRWAEESCQYWITLESIMVRLLKCLDFNGTSATVLNSTLVTSDGPHYPSKEHSSDLSKSDFDHFDL